jgi:hypothetical protein
MAGTTVSGTLAIIYGIQVARSIRICFFNIFE